MPEGSAALSTGQSAAPCCCLYTGGCRVGTRLVRVELCSLLSRLVNGPWPQARTDGRVLCVQICAFVSPAAASEYASGNGSGPASPSPAVSRGHGLPPPARAAPLREAPAPCQSPRPALSLSSPSAALRFGVPPPEPGRAMGSRGQPPEPRRQPPPEPRRGASRGAAGRSGTEG